MHHECEQTEIFSIVAFFIETITGNVHLPEKNGQRNQAPGKSKERQN